MNNKPKETIETIKNEAKEYYKWKNMLPRYIVIWFILILIVLQFILPKPKINFLDNNIKDTTWEIISQESGSFDFLWKNINLAETWTSFDIKFEKSLSEILDKKNELKFTYNKNIWFLDELEKELLEEQISKDFKYMILLSDASKSIFPINIEAEDLYELRVDEDINERLHYQKSMDVFIEHIKHLYTDFKDGNLVLMWYLMWSEELKSLMMEQNQTEFEKLYFDDEITKQYFDMLWYKYIFENISSYINTKNMSYFQKLESSVVKLWETKDLIKRANKNGYNFKEIKELNPWILDNNLPKGKREIEVLK